MASPISSPPAEPNALDRWAPLAPEGGEERVPPSRQRHSRRAERTRLDPYPWDPFRRWALRAALAVPYLIVSMLATLAPTPGTVNAALVQKVAATDWSRADARWFADIFPPISTLIAAVTPGGVFGLAVVGSLAAGVFLQKILEIMIQRQVPRSTTIILLIALSANPLFFYTATENLPGFLGLAFFGLAVAHIVRFVIWRNTQSGFSAGLMLMLSALTAQSGPLNSVTAALATPFLHLGREGQRGARWANVLVIVFPTAAALGSLAFLNWVFLGNPLGTVAPLAFAGTAERAQAVGAMLTTLAGAILVAPVLSAWLTALIVRRPGAIVVSTLVFLAQLTGYVVGIVPENSRGNIFILLILLAMVLIPAARGRVAIVLVGLIGVAQVGIAWLTAFGLPIIVEWMLNIEAAFSQILR